MRHGDRIPDGRDVQVLLGTDPVFAASGGSIGPFQYAVLYNASVHMRTLLADAGAYIVTGVHATLWEQVGVFGASATITPLCFAAAVLPAIVRAEVAAPAALCCSASISPASVVGRFLSAPGPEAAVTPVAVKGAVTPVLTKGKVA